MKETLKKSIKKIEELESLVLKTKNALAEVAQSQTVMGTNFQDFLKHQEIHKVAINSATRIDFVPVDEIIYCQASLAYTDIITSGDDELTATKSLNEFEKQLSSDTFIRISKSILININHIKSFNKRTSQVLMNNDVELDVARRRKADFVSIVLNQ